MDPTPEQVASGHAFYTRRTLAVYDLAILGFFSRFAWKCGSDTILAMYDDHVSSNHLDVGVGTGYFLDRCRFPTASPRVGLMDLNDDCLDAAAKRIQRYGPETYRANVLEPVPVPPRRFDSVSVNYLLHCLPGTMGSKARVFDHLKAQANPGAVMFGATLLHDGVQRNWLARRVMDRNNARGIFSNTGDDLAGLRRSLTQHLDDPEVDIVGCCALFTGTVPTVD